MEEAHDSAGSLKAFICISALLICIWEPKTAADLFSWSGTKAEWPHYCKWFVLPSTNSSGCWGQENISETRSLKIFVGSHPVVSPAVGLFMFWGMCRGLECSP